MSSTEIFRRHRDLLLKQHEERAGACEEFHWPVLDRFDIIADGSGRTALHFVDEYGAEVKLVVHTHASYPVGHLLHDVLDRPARGGRCGTRGV